MIGIDEVGRGCFAGPLVVCAVHLTGEIPGLKDSKQLTEAQRSKLEPAILETSSEIKLIWVSPQMIDEINLGEAMKQAVAASISSFSQLDCDIVIDGNVNYLPTDNRVRAEIKADDRIPAVMAASIIAKQARDRYMRAVDKLYPEYAFAQNVGYGTKAHRQAIEDHGVCEHHRLSYKPLKSYVSRTRQKSRGARPEVPRGQWL